MASTEGDLLHNEVSPDADGDYRLPACCDSGCIICVLDYPELFLSTPCRSVPDDSINDSRLDEMFEAIRRAQRLLDAIGAEEATGNLESEGGH